MAISKVVFGTSTLIDLSEDTISSDKMFKNETAHAADGTQIVGTAEITVDEHKLVMPIGLISV